MPYIKECDRQKFIDPIDELLLTISSKFSEGELNFCFSTICKTLFEMNKSYATANKILGVLEAVKLEFYRRHVAPYEELKRLENGDLD